MNEYNIIEIIIIIIASMTYQEWVPHLGFGGKRWR